MGKNMFVEGEANWPEEAPFHCPVYVLTNEKREPWGRPGATTFYFVSYNIKTVLEKAGEAAGSNDVRISNGAQTIQRYLNGGLIDEINIHIAPITIGKGVRLFENIEKEKFTVEIIDVTNPPMVAHLFYKVINH
jgi:dihydrofolate reductase